MIPQVTLYSSVNVLPGFPPGFHAQVPFGGEVRLEAIDTGNRVSLMQVDAL